MLTLIGIYTYFFCDLYASCLGLLNDENMVEIYFFRSKNHDIIISVSKVVERGRRKVENYRDIVPACNIIPSILVVCIKDCLNKEKLPLISFTPFTCSVTQIP